jgi:hypothetical protein
MRRKVKCCILVYYDNDKKTYNPGLILTDTDIETEICEINSRMIDEGRNVRNCVLQAVDSVDDLPQLDEPVIEAPPGYTLDPFLIW